MHPSTSMLAAALALASTAHAHIKMTYPAPYTANGDLQNGPLAPDGSDFPCKMTSAQYTPPATKNTMAINAPQTLQLLGGATHGGGSCQISLTKDLKPTKNSQWMVIHSEEGGCPSAANGNLGDRADTALPAFQYKIPETISPGEYTFSWTWFNKLGSKKRDLNNALEYNTTAQEDLDTVDMLKRDTAFPAMFVANIGNGCETDANFDLKFPNPGPNVHKVGNNFAPAKGSCKAASAGPAGSGSPGASPSSGAAGSSPSASAGGSGTPTVTGEGSGSASAPSGVASPSIVAIPPPGAPGAAQPSAMSPQATGSASSGSTGGSAAPGSIPCSTPGKSVCSPDGNKIGTCDMNKMAVMMPVAAGTKCSNGMMVHAKRSAKFVRRYGRHY